MPARRPTKPSTIQQLSTGTLLDADPATVSRHLSEQADAIVNLQRRQSHQGEDTLFSATEDGDVPASGGGTVNFLRADGSWASPAGGAVSSVSAGSAAVTAAPITGAVVVDVVPANFTGIPESGVTNLVTDLAAKVPTTRTLTGTSPIQIDGGASADLSANRTISILTSYLAGLEAFLFGSGADGACVFDGAATILGLVPAGNVYTLTRNIYPSSMTVNTGVTIKCAGWAIFCSGTITGAGTALIHGNGNDASGATGGAVSWGTGTYLGGGGQGGTGATGNGGNGGVYAGAGCPRRFASGANAGVGFGVNAVAGGTAQGGTGGSSNAGLTSGGAVAQTFLAAQLMDPDDLLGAVLGKPPTAATVGYTGGSGGGGGSGDSVNGRQGGGGGGAAGWVVVRAKAFSGSLTIQAKGGSGAAGVATAPNTGTGGGGGGGGGVVVCIAGSGSLPTLDVSGGGFGLGAAGGKNGAAGGAGLTFGLVLAP